MTLAAINKAPLLLLLPLLILVSCSKKKRVFQSDCNVTSPCKKVEFAELVNHIEKYNKQYIEVSGKYKEGFEQSALFNDSLFASHKPGKALWVNFSQDCPLFLTGTRMGLFTYNNGQFTQISNRRVIIRGKIDISDKGYQHQYKAAIGRVSFIEL